LRLELFFDEFAAAPDLCLKVAEAAGSNRNTNPKRIQIFIKEKGGLLLRRATTHQIVSGE